LGIEDGPFTIYHPSGRVAREGRLAAGRFEGLVTAYASDDPAGEPLRACCVPPMAARLDARYRSGELLSEVFYDREGRAILSDGSLCPPRPASVPELAQFDEGPRIWRLRSPEVDRLWAIEGALIEESRPAAAGGRSVRVFDEAGTIAGEYGLTADGKRDGPFLCRLAPEAPGPYADTRVRQERGFFERGHAVGTWTLLDGDGTPLRTIERGLPFRGEDLDASPALARELQDGWGLADDLIGKGRVREALCAAARAAARDGDRAALSQFLAGHVEALPGNSATERGFALAQLRGLDVTTALDGLLMGTDAAAVFRALAGMLPAISPAAADFVEASLLLGPERRMTHLTRALIRVQHGDDTGARADAAIVEAESPGAAESLLAYLRVAFRPFVFTPAAEVLVPDAASRNTLPVIAQSLGAIRHVVGVYATRLDRVRAAIRAIRDASAEHDWLPPDVSALLPAGPRTLRRESIPCEPEEGEDAIAGAGAPETIEIDEEIATDALGIPALLALAQADYVALAWLCWATGLDRVALPESIHPPETLAAAMKMVVERDWRASDQLRTRGLLALTNGVSGFEWQGMDIAAVPAHFVEMVAAEYLAARSMFLWLASPDALSPFQDDLRAPLFRATGDRNEEREP
jgi:hypothetical protein